MFEFIASTEFLRSTLLFATPIMFAALAALVSNKAGILNINVEGGMAVSALVGGLVSHFTASWLWGVLAAVVTGVLMALVFAFFALRWKTPSILTGIALNTMASGLCVYLLYVIIGVKGDSSLRPNAMIPNLALPLLKDIPVLGPVLFDQNLLVYLVLVLGIALTILYQRTRLGLHLRAVGHHPVASTSVGLPVQKLQIIALIMGGILTGLGGAYLSMVYLSYFSVGMVAGRGFIGLAAEAMGRGIPGWTMLFALLFGAVDYFAVGAQTVLGFPYELLNTLPYWMTLFALIIFALKQHILPSRRRRKLKGDQSHESTL